MSDQKYLQITVAVESVEQAMQIVAQMPKNMPSFKFEMVGNPIYQSAIVTPKDINMVHTIE